MTPGERLALLRRFEPVVRFTRGEPFFPWEVDRYVAECGLYVQEPGKPVECLVPDGQLTLRALREPRDRGPNAVYFLKFINPLSLAQMARYNLRRRLAGRRGRGTNFSAGPGRLARVGYASRLVDALFSFTLLLRGRVPGDTAAAAALCYEHLQHGLERYTYYGRVIEEGGWTILQYWFFYAFNSWRTGFHGVNDHEADWEMINVYLAPDRQRRLVPQWVAYASHDFSGDDLRRRWDDPEVEKVQGHPVVYAGAGSHSSYYSAGEYLNEIELPFLAPLLRFQEILERFFSPAPWGAEGGSAKPQFDLLRIPFVDFARGDGLAVGPHTERFWSPVLLDPVPGWVSAYRGLWGLYVRDPVAGEDAPSGPMYNRDRTVRRAWIDPLGWAGLDKVLPPLEVPRALTAEIASARAQCRHLEHKIAAKRDALRRLGLEIAAMETLPALRKPRQACQKEAAALSRELGTLQSTLASQRDLRVALRDYARRVRKGGRGPARAHLSHTPDVMAPFSHSAGRLADTWSAISIALLLLGLAALLLVQARYWVVWLVAIVVLALVVEAGLRRHFQRAVGNVGQALAVLATVLLLARFLTQVLAALALAAAAYLMWDNLRELAAGGPAAIKR